MVLSQQLHRRHSAHPSTSVGLVVYKPKPPPVGGMLFVCREVGGVYLTQCPITYAYAIVGPSAPICFQSGRVCG